MVFEAIPTSISKSQFVVDQIISRIQDGTFPPGDKLPSEREMAVQMNVSRTVVREGVKALCLSGILESRIGNGTYVVPLEERKTISETLSGRVSASVDVMEAVEARKAVDLAVIDVLRKRGVPIDTSKLFELIDEMANALDQGNISSYLNLTIDLHIAVAEATDNRLLAETVKLLADVVKERIWIIEHNYTPEKAKFSFQIHKDIVEGIAQEDFSAAIRAAERHYEEYPSIHPNQTLTEAGRASGESEIPEAGGQQRQHNT